MGKLAGSTVYPMLRKARMANTGSVNANSPPFSVTHSPQFLLFLTSFAVAMSDTFQELADIPKEFVREGTLFVRRCTKRLSIWLP